MGSAAVTSARPLEEMPVRAPQEAPPARPVAGGPLLAVCALCGGAGASTLAYLLGRHATRSAEGPVLVCDTGGPTGGLASYARVQSPRSLPRLSEAIAAHDSLAEGLFADAATGLRLIAGAPEARAEGDEDGARRLLRDARVDHALTVVDCGTLGRALDRLALAAATHVAWILPATASGVRRATPVVEQFGLDPERREIVVARKDPCAVKPPLEVLAALAEARHAPLILMPQVPDLGERHPDEGLEEAGVTLDAIEAVLSR
jgi:hypothetical protein